MTLLESLLVALSTYSAVPVPQFEWNEKNMRYAICFLPAVGVLCGLGLWAWLWLCRTLDLSGVLFAAGATALPLLLTGGIHMDGFMDTADALASHQSRERMLEIMKDSHSGAFAVLYCGVYLLLQFGLLYELFARNVGWELGLVFLLSRTLSGLCAVNLPNARKSGMLCAFTEHAQRRRSTAALALTLLVTAAVLLALSPAVGGGILAAAAVAVLAYRRLAMKTFGGVTGDTSGFFLQLCELLCLLGALVGEGVS